jgi:oligoendopeptidase F
MKKQDLNVKDVVWDLGDLYDGRDDPALARDIEWCLERGAAIEKEYSGRVGELDAAGLLALVRALEELDSRLARVSTFAYLAFVTDTRDEAAAAFLQKVRETASSVNTRTVFFELEWNAVPAARAEELLRDGRLSGYRHHLESMRRYADHLLSRAEETLLLQKAPVGRSSWTSLFDKVMGHMKFGEDGRGEEEVLADLYSPDRGTRKKAAAELTAGLASQLHVLTHIFNTILADKMIDDRLRRYPSWISSMNLYNEIGDRTVETLVETVTGRYDIPARYYRLKRDILGLDELFDYDRYAPLPRLPERTVTWEECRETVLSGFAAFSPRMAEIAAMFFDRGWIHAPVMEGKRGGAFAHPCVPGVHPYVMVNYTGNLRDVSTVAHELGHGVHQYLAAEQGFYNSDTTLVLAETASVFAELVLFRGQMEMIENAEERRGFIAQKLESIFATVFRQVAMNRFEDAIHNRRREGGELSADELGALWIETQEEMFAGSVTLTDDYRLWWSYIPHFLSTPGYVYSYAFGELLVLSLYRIYREEGPGFVDRYLDLLAAGGSDTPGNLLAPFGIDLDSPEFWSGGLEVIDGMLAEMEG